MDSRVVASGKQLAVTWLRAVACTGRAPWLFVSASAIAVLLNFEIATAGGANPTSTCCSDLEQRIADLEAAQVQTSRRGFELKVSGSVNQAVLFWDDGGTHSAAVVTNDNDNSTATLEGETRELAGGWSVGFIIDFDLLSSGSSDTNQRAAGETAFEPGEVSFWIKNEHFGQLSMGLTSAKGSSGGANEADLSGTEVAAYVGVTDIGGGFFVRRQNTRGDKSAPGSKASRSDSGLTAMTWNDVIDSLDEPDGSVISYNSPELAGFAVSGLWGEDDVWNAGAAYTNKVAGPFTFVAKMAYNEDLQGALVNSPNDQTLSGSIALLHVPSGLNLTIAGGERRYTQAVPYNNGTTGVPASPSFAYLKAGWRTALVDWGDTAVYAEAGRFQDFLGANAGANIVAGLAGDLRAASPAAPCATATAACLVSGSDAFIAGAGIVQRFDDANAQLYLGARHYEAEVSLVNAKGAKVHSAPLSGFDTVIGGLLIEF